MWWILVAIAVIPCVYWLLRRPHQYWIQRGVKQGNPGFLLGDNWGNLTGKQSFAEMLEMVYNVSPNSRYSGAYSLLSPTLIIRDPDLIKQITVKDFDHFVDHQVFVPEGSDPLWDNNLFALTGKRWREMRATLSPAFTSSKIKSTFSLISQSSDQFVQYFLKKEEDVVTLEMRDVFTRFANDVIANTAFGVEIDSHCHRNNEFYLMGKEVTDFTGLWRTLKIFSFVLMPQLSKMLKARLFSKEVSDFFNDLVKTNIKSREKLGIVRPDMIHLLLEARKNGLKNEESQPTKDESFATAEDFEINKNQDNSRKEITDQDIASQAMIFLFAGFDTVSSLMCFMSYELAVNSDIQEKLIQEVDETRRACNGKVTYESLIGMKYMDMVVSEALRKWPITINTDRKCTNSYTIEPKYPDEKPLHLEKNDNLWIPIYAIHRDPQNYPEPDRFIPERFSEENKANIKPYTYLPFGAGPRNCIGSRFALMEIKIIFFHILTHFQIVPVQKTQIPLVLCKKQFSLTAENGFWLGLKRR